MRETKGATAKAQRLDISVVLERITTLVKAAEVAHGVAKARRTAASIADAQRQVEEAWACIALHRDVAREHPATEAYVAREAGRLLSVHEALAVFHKASSMRIRSAALIGPSVARARPASRRPQ